LITSPDFRRMAAASSPTVTDSGTLMSSRLISTGGSGGSGGYGHAFATTTVLQVVLLAVSAVVATFLPRRIAPGAYQR